MKKENKISQSKVNALSMIGRKVGAFKDKRKGRGGSSNEELDLFQEYLEYLDEQSNKKNED